MMIVRRRFRRIVRTRNEISIAGSVTGCPTIRHNRFRLSAVATLHNGTFPTSHCQPISFLSNNNNNNNNSSSQQLLYTILSRQNRHHPSFQTIAARRSLSSGATTTLSSVVDDDDNTKNNNNKNKPWMDLQRTLASRVEALVHDSPWIHPAEFRIDSNIHLLLLECCRLRTLQGQQMAQDIMERLLLEKAKLHQQQQSSSSSFRRERQRQESSSDDDLVVYIPERFWQNVIFGWSKLAGKLRVARLQMKENLQNAIEAAKDDYRHDQERRKMTVCDDNSDERNGGGSSSSSNSSEPTVELFNTYLLGLSRAAKIGPGAAMQAESTLFDMMEYHEKFGWHTKPNTKSYTHVINAHDISCHKSSGIRALDILHHVKQTHEAEKLAYLDRVGIPYHERGPNHPRIVTPDGIMYTSVMWAMLHSQNMSAQRVVELLHEFLDMAKKCHDDGDDSIQVDASHFLVPIRALGNGIDRIRNAAHRVKLAQQAESILNLMFEYMAQKKQRMAAIIDKGGAEQEEQEDVQFQKALYAFNACLDTWGRAFAPEAALRCDDLLKKMLDKNINPTTTTTTTTTNTGASTTEDSINVVVEPDTVSFNACLQAWSKAHSFYPDAAYRTNELLDLYRHLHTSGFVKKGPDLQSWTVTILALQHVKPNKSDNNGNDNKNASSSSSSSSSSGANIVRRARRLLDEMLDSVQNQSTQISRNLSGPFTAVIRVAAKMADNNKADSSTTLPNKTKENGNDVFAFGENMDDDDQADADMDPYAIACRTYREAIDDLYHLKERQRTKNRMEQNDNNQRNDYNDGDNNSNNSGGSGSTSSSGRGIADHHTFAAMLTCIDRYNPHPASSERKTFGDAVFADACQAGQVSRVVLHEAAFVLQIPAAVVAVSANVGNTERIPRFWYRNVEGSWKPT